MTYSVWNYGTRLYDYYTAPGAHPIHAGAPSVRRGSSLGSTPEQAAWTLPAGATKVGSGELPKGRIASRGAGGALGGVDLSDPGTVIAVIALSYVAWKNRRHIL